MQKSLHGLDYITTDGVQAFEVLEDIVSTLKAANAVTSNWEKETKQQLLDAKRYLKADFRLHVSRDERCAHHCTVYPLSSPNDPSFKSTCTHAHDIRCDACCGTRRARRGHEAACSEKLLRLLSDRAQTLHNDRNFNSKQSYRFCFLILTVFGGKMTPQC